MPGSDQPAPFTAMRQSVEDRAALELILAESAKRRRGIPTIEASDRRRQPMATALIAGPLIEAEQLAALPGAIPGPGRSRVGGGAHPPPVLRLVGGS